MKEIKTLADLGRVKKDDNLSGEYLGYIEEYFHLLVESLSDGIPPEDFSLEKHGYIVILEAGDDLRDLEEIGLNPAARGLLGSHPEFIERYECGGFAYYRIGILYDNEYMMILFSEVGIHDAGAEAWLAERARGAGELRAEAADLPEAPF